MTQNLVPGTPNWVDLATTEIPAAAAFYREVFGWSHLDFGPEMGGYGMFLLDDRQVGGVGPAPAEDRGSVWQTYFSTADADAVASRVERLGGRVVSAPVDVADQGRMATFTDPSGAYFSVWQPGLHTGAEVTLEPGSMCWHELSSPDVERAGPFYGEALGVGVRVVPIGEESYTLLEAGGQPVAGAMATPGRPPEWMVYFAVDDCDRVHERAVRHGAVSRKAPTDSPPGRYAFLTDPQGASFGILRGNPDFQV
jgi:uncharacterized protein